MAKELSPLAAAAEEEKARLKDEKKQFKQLKKAQKKEAKRRAAEIAKQEEALGEDGGSGLVTFAATLLIVALWVAVVCVVVKMDVGGFGSGVLAPILKDVPVVNKILPSTAPAAGTEDPDTYGGYASLEEAVDYIKELEQQLEQIQNTSTTRDAEIEALKAEILRLQEFEQRQVEFQRIMTEFYEEVADIDPEGLLKYYESMDPATMEHIVRQVAVQEQKNEKLDDYVQTFALMKPKEAAKTFESMDDNLELVAEILEAMTAEQRASIMDVIDKEVAAKLAKMMHPGS